MSKKAFVVALENGSEYQPVPYGEPETRGIYSGGVYLELDWSCG